MDFFEPDDVQPTFDVQKPLLERWLNSVLDEGVETRVQPFFHFDEKDSNASLTHALEESSIKLSGFSPPPSGKDAFAAMTDWYSTRLLTSVENVRKDQSAWDDDVLMHYALVFNNALSLFQ